MRAAGSTAITAVLLLLATAACLRYEPQSSLDSQRPLFELPIPETRKVGDVTVHTLKNGLTLIHKRNTSNAIVGLTCYVDTGAAHERDEKAGLTNLLASVLTKGTKNRSADEISEEVEGLGASLSANANYDFLSVSMQCVLDDLGKGMDLLSDVLLNANFPLDEIDTERTLILANIRMKEDSTPSYVMRRFRKELFGFHPYGRPIDGEPETLPNITQEDLITRHDETFVPSNMILAAVGDISFDDLKDLVEKHLGGVEKVRKPWLTPDKVIKPSAELKYLAKEAEQGFVVMGNVVCPAGDEDQAAVDVAAGVLGYGMSSRLFVTLRDQQGLAYAVGSSAAFYEKKGMMISYIGTKTESLDPAREGLWSQILRLRDEPVPADELERAQNYILGGYLRSHQTNMQQAHYLAYWQNMGFGVEYDAAYPDKVRAVTSRDVMRVANKYFLDPTTVVLRPLPAGAGK